MKNKIDKKCVLILGANSDVAKACINLYVKKNFFVFAASRNTVQLEEFVQQKSISKTDIEILHFDATAFETHQEFYTSLSRKPNVVLYAAGYLKENVAAMHNWQSSFEMMKVHYCGAVSILNIIATDETNLNLERIIGLSSLSGVRGRKSNFIYGSTKAAFTQYLAGLRQFLSSRNITVNVVIAGYIRSKMTEGLQLTESLMLEPEFIANAVVSAPKNFILVPGLRWKAIYFILKMLPEKIVAKLP